MTANTDLQVSRISAALDSWTVDVIVTGSIGAVESVRFIRALRRLGARVVPWLTDGGAQFVTETALAWAAASEVRRTFQGEATHIATADACVVAPASASFIGKMALGLTDTPASALVASHLGQNRPVLVLPNMHDSLLNSPGVHKNIETLKHWGLRFLESRNEEGKAKFPDPSQTADLVAHHLNRAKTRERGMNKLSVLVTMGSTRGYIDDVRYISNYSSGALGSLVSEELFRLGLGTRVVCGPCPIKPRVYGRLVDVQTNDQMKAAALEALHEGASGAVLAASVLDFVPSTKLGGKISSKESGLTVEMRPAEKIIAAVTPTTLGNHPAPKVGFKLEVGLDEARAAKIAADYMQKYKLSLMVLNDLNDVDEKRHAAFVYESDAQGKHGAAERLVTKEAVAARIAAHVASRLNAGH